MRRVAFLSSKHRSTVVGNVGTNPKLRLRSASFIIRQKEESIRLMRWSALDRHGLLERFRDSKAFGLFSGPRRYFLFQLAEVLCKSHLLRRRPQQPRIRKVISGQHPDELQEHQSRRTTCRAYHKNKTKSMCFYCKHFICGLSNLAQSNFPFFVVVFFQVRTWTDRKYKNCYFVNCYYTS